MASVESAQMMKQRLLHQVPLLDPGRTGVPLEQVASRLGDHGRDLGFLGHMNL
jgi:hypothetical protein